MCVEFEHVLHELHEYAIGLCRQIRAIHATRTHYLSLGRRFMEQESGEIGWMQDSWPPLH